MTNLAKIKCLYLWKPSICKTFWTTLVCFDHFEGIINYRSSVREISVGGYP